MEEAAATSVAPVVPIIPGTGQTATRRLSSLRLATPPQPPLFRDYLVLDRRSVLSSLLSSIRTIAIPSRISTRTDSTLRRSLISLFSIDTEEEGVAKGDNNNKDLYSVPDLVERGYTYKGINSTL